MDIKLIACDLDGTLLPEGAMSGSKEDFELIRALQQRGIIFAPTSGRPYGNIRRTLYPVADDLFYICDNGANVVYHDRVIYREPMDQKLAFELIDCINAMGEEYESVICTADNYVLMPKRDKTVIDILRCWNMSVRIAKDKEHIIDPILKYTMYMGDGLDWATVERLTNEWSGKVKHISVAGNTWLDFQDGDKGSALLRSLEFLGIAPENVIAFGDNYNDIGMLDTAGYSYAVSHAADDVKKHADAVCGSVQEVLREILAGT